MTAPRMKHAMAAAIALLGFVLFPSHAASQNPCWNEIVTTGGPSPRFGHVAIHDPVRNRMIVHGGVTTSGLSNETWALSLTTCPPTWQQLPSPATLERWGHRAVFDPTGNRMIFFGGQWSATLVFNDVWALDLSTDTWEQIVPLDQSRPCPRTAANVLFVPSTRELYVWGGQIRTASFQPIDTHDLWILRLDPAAGSLYKKWRALDECTDHTDCMYDGVGEQCNPATYPSPRSYSGTLYDAVSGRAIMHGGWYDLDDKVDGETWVSYPGGMGTEVGTWSLPTIGAGRMAHAAVIDPLRGRRAVVFGGLLNSNTRLNDVQAISLGPSGPTGTWAPITTTGTPPTPRDEATMIYDPTYDRFLVFGGHAQVGGVVSIAGDLRELRYTPAPISLYAEPEGGYRSVLLSWTSPACGSAVEFDLRRSSAPITCANFASATPVNNEPTPGSPGTLHVFNVTGLGNCAL